MRRNGRTEHIYTSQLHSKLVYAGVACVQTWGSGIRRSLSGPSLTLRSPANESPACLSSAPAPWRLFDSEDNKDSCCPRPGTMSRRRLAACQRSAARCARCYNPHGSAGGRTLVLLCVISTDDRKRPVIALDMQQKQGDTRSHALKNTRCYLHEDGSCSPSQLMNTP